jgi:hypothetical protein
LELYGSNVVQHREREPVITWSAVGAFRAENSGGDGRHVPSILLCCGPLWDCEWQTLFLFAVISNRYSWIADRLIQTEIGPSPLPSLTLRGKRPNKRNACDDPGDTVIGKNQLGEGGIVRSRRLINVGGRPFNLIVSHGLGDNS